MVLSGGVSMGKADYVPEVLAELDVEVIFHKDQPAPWQAYVVRKRAARPTGIRSTGQIPYPRLSAAVSTLFRP